MDLHTLCQQICCGFVIRREFSEFRIAPWRPDAQHTDALRNLVNRQSKLRILRLKHQMQGVEERTFDFSVKIVSLEIQRMAVSQQA